MPIRLTCPSCSATLSVKDEYAGRAVKCPKCGGVIPASQSATPAAPAAAPAPPPAKAAPAAPPPPPEPAPAPAAEKSPFEELDEPAKPAKTGGKITGKPVSRSADADEDDEERPRRKGRDDDDEDRPRRKRDEDDGGARSKDRGDRDEDGEDRPRRKRRDDDDDDEPPRGRRGKPQGGKSNTGMILLLVGGFLLLCCGGVVGAGYYAFIKVKEKAQEVAGNIEKWNPSVNKPNFDSLKVGTTTRTQAENLLGTGKAPTDDEINAIFGWDKSSADSWKKYVAKNRALMWRNADDYILVLFHPDLGPDRRVQLKEWKPKNPPGHSDGSNDDVMFLANYPAKKDGNLSGPAVDVRAEDLCKAYKDDKNAADGKYKDKVVLVEGKLEAIDLMPDGTMYARLFGVGQAGAGGLQVRCVVQPGDVNKIYNCSRGQSIKFRGRCAGLVAIFVDVMDCKFESSGPDPSVPVTAAALLSAYAANEGTADEKYKEKPLTVTNATVESKTADTIVLVGTGKAAKTNLKIKMAIGGDFKKLFENVKVGDRIKVKGEGGGLGLDGNTVYLNGGWLVP